MQKTKLFLLALIGIVIPIQANNWMKRLPDNTLVSVLSIPGSHDSGTGHGFTNSVMGSLGNQYARTQDLNIHEQWQLGVRAFDMRPSLYGDYINVNHGMVPTKLRFNNALRILRDSLVANPSEFAIIHILHASDGDQVSDNYTDRLLALLGESDLKDFFVSFRKDLKLKDVRGKILLISRDRYADTPIGGFFQGWTGDLDWSRQTQASILGPNGQTATLFVQDFSDTHASGDLKRKLEGMKQLLRVSCQRNTSNTIWVYNLASAYSKVTSLFGNDISLSDGYRDNATYTNAAIVEFLSDASNPVGPTGIVLMDYAGVDWSGEYQTAGLQAVNSLRENNFRYLRDLTTVEEDNVTASTSVDMTPLIINPAFNSNILQTGWQGDAFGAASPQENAEHYNCTYDTYQTLTGLPNGVYAVSAAAFYRAGDADVAYNHFALKDDCSRLARLYAVSGTDTLAWPLVSPYSRRVIKARGVGREASHTDGTTTFFIPDDMVSAEHYMHSLYAYKNTLFVVVDNHQLTFGVKKGERIDADWSCFDDFQLTYFGSKADAYKRWTDELTNMHQNYDGITVSQSYRESYDAAFNTTITGKAQGKIVMKRIMWLADTLALNARLWAEYKEMAAQAQTAAQGDSLSQAVKRAINNYLSQVFTPAVATPVLTNAQLREEMALLAQLMSGDLSQIVAVPTAADRRVTYYTLDGKPVSRPLKKGIYIERTANGRTRKVVK